MPIIYRHDKGGPLTIEEIDGNFAYLDRRLLALETDGIQSEGIAHIRQDGDIIEIVGTRGTSFGRFMLPRVIPNPRGAWEDDTPYAILDWVQNDRGLYACIVPHRAHVFADDLRSGFWKILMEV
ncbi:MAG: hypothetical protein WCG04_00595 [Alphaproteobacteria bacterium]